MELIRNQINEADFSNLHGFSNQFTENDTQSVILNLLFCE